MLLFTILFFISGVIFLFIGFTKIFQKNMIYLILFRIFAALFFFAAFSIAYLPTQTQIISNVIITNSSTNSIISTINGTSTLTNKLSDPTNLVFSEISFVLMLSVFAIALIEVVQRLGYLN